jgi:GxxExxY protein
MAGILHAPRRRMATEAKINRISEQIIGAAVQVHRRIGPGCLESAYSPCLAVELQKRGLDFSTQVALTFKGTTSW